MNTKKENEVTVKIKWDSPDDENWLNPDNVAVVLHAYCENTKFEVTEVIITPELDKGDCALIIKQDMTMELIIPDFDDNETVDWDKNQNVFVGMAISSSMSDEKFREYIKEKIDAIFKTADSLKKDDTPEAEFEPVSESPCGTCPGCSIE